MPITPDNFAEFSPNMWKSSAEARKFGENSVVLPEKLTGELKQLVALQKDTGYSDGFVDHNNIAAVEKYQKHCFLYHRVPDHMHGDVLYPLNELKNISRELYDLYAEGYKDREKLTKTRIPVLDCLWNDVLFLSPVYPQKLYDLAKSVGLEKQWRFSRFYAFEIGVNMGLINSAVFYRVGKDLQGMIYRPAKEVRFSELDKVPDITKSYYELVAKNKEDLYPYQFVPQTMHKGTLDTVGVKIVDIKR